MAQETPHFNPVTKTVLPWINLAQLNATYGPRMSSSSPPPVPLSPAGVPMHPPSQKIPPLSRSQPPGQLPARPAVPPAPSQPQWQSAPIATAAAFSPIQDPKDLENAILTKWAKQPPTFTTTKPIAELLSTIDCTFSFVEPHDYFEKKFHPVSKEAVISYSDVLKRAVRKMRFFLHPDRLPKDFNDQQQLLCRTLWDVMTEAWESHETSP